MDIIDAHGKPITDFTHAPGSPFLISPDYNCMFIGPGWALKETQNNEELPMDIGMILELIRLGEGRGHGYIFELVDNDPFFEKTPMGPGHYNGAIFNHLRNLPSYGLPRCPFREIRGNLLYNRSFINQNLLQQYKQDDSTVDVFSDHGSFLWILHWIYDPPNSPEEFIAERYSLNIGARGMVLLYLGGGLNPEHLSEVMLDAIVSKLAVSFETKGFSTTLISNIADNYRVENEKWRAYFKSQYPTEYYRDPFLIPTHQADRVLIAKK